MGHEKPLLPNPLTLQGSKHDKLSGWDVVYSLNMAIACLIMYWIITYLLSRFVDQASEFLGGMWAVVAVVFVFRDTRARAVFGNSAAYTMIAVQVMANDVAVGFGGAGGYLETSVYKPLVIFNITHSKTIMSDGCANFRKFLIEGSKPNLKKIKEYVDRSLMLVTALSPVIGYDKASKIEHYAMDNDLTLKAAALKLGFVTEELFDRVVDPAKMVRPYVARETSR